MAPHLEILRVQSSIIVPNFVLVTLIRTILHHTAVLKQPMSVTDYLYNWYPKVQDPNYTFMFEMMFTYFGGFFAHHAGMRRNNSLYKSWEGIIFTIVSLEVHFQVCCNRTAGQVSVSLFFHKLLYVQTDGGRMSETF